MTKDVREMCNKINSIKTIINELKSKVSSLEKELCLVDGKLDREINDSTTKRLDDIVRMVGEFNAHVKREFSHIDHSVMKNKRFCCIEN